jgi:hypothetical protein
LEASNQYAMSLMTMMGCVGGPAAKSSVAKGISRPFAWSKKYAYTQIQRLDA